MLTGKREPTHCSYSLVDNGRFDALGVGMGVGSYPPPRRSIVTNKQELTHCQPPNMTCIYCRSANHHQCVVTEIGKDHTHPFTSTNMNEGRNV